MTEGAAAGWGVEWSKDRVVQGSTLGCYHIKAEAAQMASVIAGMEHEERHCPISPGCNIPR